MSDQKPTSRVMSSANSAVSRTARWSSAKQEFAQKVLNTSRESAAKLASGAAQAKKS
jgi:hypothetical protein